MAENADKKVSPEKPPSDVKGSDIPKTKSPIPQLENYIHPIKLETLQSIEPHIELTLPNFTKKLEQSKESNLILKRKIIEIQNKEILPLFKEKESITEINDTELYETIFDCVNFYHFITNDEEKIEKKEIDINLLDKLFNKNLSQKGTLLLLCDYHYLC